MIGPGNIAVSSAGPAAAIFIVGKNAILLKSQRQSSS